MSVYSNKISAINSINELSDISVESLLMDESVNPCSEDNFITAGARICAENTINMNNILEACAIEEFCYLEENGTEMVYEGGKLDSFFTKIKNFFLKLWEKIKSIFKKAILMFDSHAKKDKDFLNKYKKELNQASNKGFGDKEVSIFKYIWYTGYKIEKNMSDLWDANEFKSMEDIDTAITNICAGAGVSTLPQEIDKLSNDTRPDDDAGLKQDIDKIEDKIKTINEQDWRDDDSDGLRGLFIDFLGGSDSPVSASEFAKEIKEAIQGGESAKDEYSLSTAVNWARNFLESSDNIKKSFDNSLKLWKRDIDSTVKSLERKQKEFIKDSSKEPNNKRRANNYKHSVISAAIAIMQIDKNIGITFHSNIIQGIKACSAQSRSICVQAINYKKPKNESTDIFGESGSLIDNVELI